MCGPLSGDDVGSFLVFQLGIWKMGEISVISFGANSESTVKM